MNKEIAEYDLQASSSVDATKKKLNEDKNLFYKVKPFAVGGVSGMFATFCVQPLDMIKVRIQLNAEGTNAIKNPIIIAKNIIKDEGVLSLYKGLDAGLTRQIVYTTGRLGLFRTFSDMVKKEGEPLPFYKKCFCALAAGGLGAFLGNPADLSLIRLQADNTLPKELKRNYSGVFNALYRIAKEEGIFALWKGSVPTIARAMSLNLGMLSTYDQSKEYLEKYVGVGMKTNLIASVISGFFAVTMSLPFDFVKTCMQKMKVDPVTKKMPYKNFFDCSYQLYKKGGIAIFYSSYSTYYVRIAPHAMITLMTMDYLNNLLKKFC
ncbi:dicarboxylate/tricarboxylate carrier [Plasmodium brasilianum]|uniref:Dicarboxylate/tricarboxylate carrier, putative n=2 Tax=Plasmodium (Plasmodium) TaxID=418103 RepID=A0A1A8WWY9_PLAMA|nr:dicarboxylate/tricarboxylate carrier, putative [Plasmodium malariae]KAI4839990.1 dicarboxylate/tricarboxylate carrier [Plasmodium brasilianum]SBS96399.1 dicarboxylate/tricarboxylate carrier, putative [Plasmodium malariae]SBT87358.1 dicarboxylate/tricarboxylate carrier, putative [Plasmodium malariae]